MQKAVDAGGTVTFPAGIYLLNQTIVISKSNTIIQGAGPSTVFIFKPTLPQVHCVNDRAFTTPCDVVDRTTRRQISGAIAKGDASFVAAMASDVGDLKPGDWLIIAEKDLHVSDVVVIDWAQVASVSGNVVNVQSPFRTAFPNARSWDPIRSGLGFFRVPQLVQGVQFRDFTVIVPDSGENAPGISVFAAKQTVIDHVIVEDPHGQSLYSYLSKDLTVSNSYGKGAQILSEFAGTVDLSLKGNTFSADTAGCGLDLGTGYFVVSGNYVPSSVNIGFYATNGVHDGLITNNFISTVGATQGGNAVGILARGVHHLKVAGNYLAGGAGVSSLGISIGPDFNLDVPILSLRNKVVPNSFGAAWGVDYDPAVGVFDLDGDNKTDLAVYRPAGAWYVTNSRDGSQTQRGWGVPGDIPVPGDYDGDGKTDLAVFRQGNWLIVNSSDGSYRQVNWGLPGDIPIPADYNGDGKVDPAVFRQGTWFIVNSSDGSYTVQHLGVGGDVPVPGDYDGDGSADIAIYRQGNWLIVNSSDGSYRQVNWGVPGDIPVPGDYDGDGKTDIAVWRPSNGNWYIINSSDGSYTVLNWGASGDMPIPADYDGDGKTDIAIWNAGAWSIHKSSDGTSMNGMKGTAGDIPVPASPYWIRRNF